MRIPSRAEFAPLAELVAMFGTPDPLAVLPELENNLEAVKPANAHIRDAATRLRGAATDLEAEAAAVRWRGGAAGGFRSTVAGGVHAMRNAADQLDELAQVLDVTPDQVQSVIIKILEYLAAAAAIAAAIIALVVGGPPIVVAGAIITFIGALIAIVAFLVRDFDVISEQVAAVINFILDLLCPHPVDPRV